MIKQLNAVRGILKPQFMSKLKLKHAEWVEIDANVKLDTYTLRGKGLCSETMEVKIKECVTQKLSDNPIEKKMLIRKVKKSIKEPYRDTHRVKMTLNFSEFVATGECWYETMLIDEKTGKNRCFHKEFKSNF